MKLQLNIEHGKSQDEVVHASLKPAQKAAYRDIKGGSKTIFKSPLIFFKLSLIPLKVILKALIPS